MNFEQQQQQKLIDHFVNQASSLHDLSLVNVIVDATSHPSFFAFSDILSVPNIIELQGTEHSVYLDLLRIFADGSWTEYKRNASNLPPLVPGQILKLKQLTLLTLAEKNKILPYDVLMQELDVENVPELEDFLTNKCMYSGIVRGKLDQFRRCFQTPNFEDFGKATILDIAELYRDSAMRDLEKLYSEPKVKNAEQLEREFAEDIRYALEVHSRSKVKRSDSEINEELPHKRIKVEGFRFEHERVGLTTSSESSESSEGEEDHPHETFSLSVLGGLDCSYISELLFHPTAVHIPDDLQTEVPHDMKRDGDDDVIASIKDLARTVRSSPLTTTQIEALICEQTRYANAFSDVAIDRVMGRLSFTCDGVVINGKKRSLMVPTDIDKVCNLSSDALFILLVESDDIYFRLIKDRFWDRFPCIIVHLEGQPCVSTWLFVWKLKFELKLPVLALVDSAPYSLKKLCVFGSNNPVYDVNWLGLRPSEWDKYGISDCFRSPMEKQDIEYCNDLFKQDFVKNNPERIAELKLMLEWKQKVELQVLSIVPGYLIDHFLRKKLLEKDWI